MKQEDFFKKEKGTGEELQRLSVGKSVNYRSDSLLNPLRYHEAFPAIAIIFGTHWVERTEVCNLILHSYIGAQGNERHCEMRVGYNQVCTLTRNLRKGIFIWGCYRPPSLVAAPLDKPVAN